MIFLYKSLTFLNAVHLLGNIYCSLKFYRIKHHWGPFIAVAFAGDAINDLIAVITVGLGLVPRYIPWWSISLIIFGRVAMTAGVILLTAFLFGWIGDINNPKSEAK